MSREDRTKVSIDIRAVELCWPIGMPLCRPLSRGLWEIRTNLQNCIARVIFCVHNEQMVLLHGFIKKSREVPQEDLELAFQRKRLLARAR